MRLFSFAQGYRFWLPLADFEYADRISRNAKYSEHSIMLTEHTTTNNLALRPREAAKAMGISERSLWEWTHRGDVPFVRIGRTILYPVDALRDWLNRHAGTAKGGEHDSR